MTEEPRHPDARAPDRKRFFDVPGARLRGYEWGDPKAPKVLLVHGFFDHGRGFDLLAPILAEQYHVIAIDSRGHGESSWADNYLWTRDLSDILHLLKELGPATHLVGHSKGGGQLTDAATIAPELTGRLVNLDGFGPPNDAGFRPPGAPDIAEMSIPERCAFFLERRRRANERVEWKASPTLEDLVMRRGRQNPRLEATWLRYFVYHAAKQSEEGWCWKADPMMTGGGFGPFRPDWIAPSWKHLEVTMLAVIGSDDDHWGPLPEEVLAKRLAYVPRLERATIEGAGHFIHMEEAARVGRVILDFLGAR